MCKNAWIDVLLAAPTWPRIILPRELLIFFDTPNSMVQDDIRVRCVDDEDEDEDVGSYSSCCHYHWCNP